MGWDARKGRAKRVGVGGSGNGSATATRGIYIFSDIFHAVTDT